MSYFDLTDESQEPFRDPWGHFLSLGGPYPAHLSLPHAHFLLRMWPSSSSALLPLPVPVLTSLVPLSSPLIINPAGVIQMMIMKMMMMMISVLFLSRHSPRTQPKTVFADVEAEDEEDDDEPEWKKRKI